MRFNKIFCDGMQLEEPNTGMASGVGENRPALDKNNTCIVEQPHVAVVPPATKRMEAKLTSKVAEPSSDSASWQPNRELSWATDTTELPRPVKEIGVREPNTVSAPPEKPEVRNVNRKSCAL